MRIKLLFAVSLIFSIILGSHNAYALVDSHFTTTSALSSGKWAKIQVSETGVHEITAKQLAQMGFSDISKVKIFGRGGHALSETLNSSLPDDISQIPAMRRNDKIYFYGVGATSFTISSSSGTNNNPYTLGNVNPYSNYGYYFITDSNNFPVLEVATSDSQEATTTEVTTCYDFVYHNSELFSFHNSGKTFYGEDLTKGNKFTFTMPGRIDGSPITLAFSVGSNLDATSTVTATIDNTDVTLSSQKISVSSSNLFSICSPIGYVNDIASADSHTLAINIADTGINSARLDYYSITYTKSTEFPTDSAQMRMYFKSTSTSNAVSITNAEADLIVWDITDEQEPIAMTTTSAEKKITFPQTSMRFVAFSPSRSQKAVTVIGQVENQNLHAEKTPDMLIIYPKGLKSEAERLAEVHRVHDKFDVLLAEQENIFNEFSAGTPDAMAYRLLTKMLYDRNPEKLKYLLLFGNGSFDNRQLFGAKSENQLLTYQSANSNGKTNSYITDDFFVLLTDNSGGNIPSEKMSICVGRIPACSLNEAKAAVNKTIDYILDNSSQSWRSNLVLLSDHGDDNLHTVQTELVETALKTTLNGESLHINKIFQEWYTTSSIADESTTFLIENRGRDKLENLLKQGLSYVSFTGHSGPSSITYGNKLWHNAKIQSVKYEHLPVFLLASCQVAEYDAVYRSFAEELILAPQGGAIGALAAAREVTATQNNKLNCAFSSALFSLKDDGSYRTIGEAVRDAKLSFTSYNVNKLQYILFGDPAVKFRFPVNRCSITTVNEIEVSDDVSIAVKPLSPMSISGVVNTADGTIDTSFNGDITVTIFDKSIFYKTLVNEKTKQSADSYYPRETLCHTSGKVTNGVFNIDITLPANCQASDETCLIQVFAQSDDNRLVSGCEDRIIIGAYDATATIDDNEAPKIKKITIDGTDANNVVNASESPIITFNITDNFGINTKPNDIQNAMKLSIDGGSVNINSLSNYTTATNGGKNVSGNVQLPSLSTGRHTLRLEVSDLAGNTSFKEYVFYVTLSSLEGSLTASNDVARDEVEITLNTDFDVKNVNMHIGNVSCSKIFTKSINGNSLKWNLKDANGTRLSPGKYTVYATFQGDDGSGSTEPIHIVVLSE